MTRLSAVGGVFAILLVLFGAARATAQIPQEMNGLPIVEIRVRGEASAIVDPSELGIRKGVPLRRQLLRRATQELLSSGQWGNVQFDATPVPGGVRLTVTLTPRATILRIDLRGNEQLSDDEVVRAAEIAQGAVLADLDLDGVPSRLGDAYRNVGYYDVEVKVLVRDTDDPTRKVVVFEISEGEPTRIRGISFEGESPPPASGFLDGAGISTGQVLHRRRLDERLRAGARYARERGYFETNISSPRIRIRDGGAEIRISAYFGPRYDLEMRGYAPLAESEVASELELSNEPLSDGAMAGFEERVADLYRRHGYWKATARAFSLPPNRKGRAKLRIDIIPGTQARVLSVAFPGARHLSQEDLREQVFSYLEQDLPGSTYLHPVDPEVANVGGAGAKERWRRDAKRPVLMDPRTTYYEATYNEAVASVLERYQAEGFLRAEVGPHRVRVLNDKELLVEIPVFEGPRAFLRSLSIKGTKSIARGTLLEATELRQGAPFSHLALEQARIRMADLYREEGFLYVRVEAQVSLSEDGTLAAVAFEIVEGFQVHVGEVIIRGAKDTKESLIRDTLALSPGDLYRPSRATRSQEKLLDLGVFSGVNIAPLDAELPARVKPIVVTVTELKPQLLEPRAGFSTGEGLRGGFEYRYRNLFGYAISVSLYTNLAYQFIFIDDEIERRFESLSTLDRLERNVTLGFGFPRVPLLPDTRATISGGLLRDNERDFGLEKVGGTISLAWRPTRRLTFTVAEDLEQNVVDLFVTNSLNDYLLNNTDPRLERLLRVPEGESVILATRASAA
ncbi:MAG: hypothetical protein KC416_08070, partial [Myxococcales bacterium]|nr:hypothetical protein [Myxococcales bacterium]